MTRRLRLIALICILALLGGCGLPEEFLRHAETRNTQLGAPETRETAVLETMQPLYTDGAPAVLWGREQLEEHTKKAYDLLSAAVACCRETPLEVDASADEVQLILTALRIDHPEYFWFDGQTSFVSTTLAGIDIRTECTFSYTMGREEIQRAHQEIRQYTAACLSALDLDGAETDYEKILGVYRYIIEQTDYVSAETDQSILSVMARHKATCAGYARAFQYIMSQLGIPCTLAIGLDENGEPHGWNMVKCGGAWYQIDVTWGDPVGRDDAPGDSIQYTYCLVTDGEIYQDHTLVSDIPMPVCTATAYNYYVQEQRLLRDWDPEAYQAAMTRARAQGETWFSVRFTTREAYEEAVRALFDGEEIWTILRRSGAAGTDETRVSYSTKELFREISVRLGEGGPGAELNEQTVKGDASW